jgi:hypothetical protein
MVCLGRYDLTLTHSCARHCQCSHASPARQMNENCQFLLQHHMQKLRRVARGT